jgi:hypothetical protein
MRAGGAPRTGNAPKSVRGLDGGVEAPEAIQQAQAHLRNAMDLAKQPLASEQLLYMWDNQITALDNFLADTEVLKNPLLAKARESMRNVKKQLTDAVIKFEAKQEGVVLDDEPEPAPEDWAAAFVEQGEDLVDMVRAAAAEKVKDLQELITWEEPLAILNGYLADSEPYQELSKDLRRVRSLARAARRDLKERIADVVASWKAQADRDSGDDDED